MADAQNDLAARLQRLEDIEAIKQLKARYFRAIDTADIAALETLLTEDIAVDYKGGSYHWQVSGRAAVLGAIGAGFHNRAIASHNGHTPEIDITGPDSASGIWYLADTFLHRDSLVTTIGTALYRDRYVRQGGVWRICASSYTRIYEIVDTLEKAPNVTYAVLAETGRAPAA